ncbi:hypothetical protein K525DRAFT_255273 [Schizophyllum commune Loenen D]|nr:hypothetical protein K525DRAFT_255273 [Schizophyllum commune Loenen D]
MSAPDMQQPQQQQRQQFEVQFAQNVTPTSYATEVATGGPVPPVNDFQTDTFLFAPDEASEPEQGGKKRRRRPRDVDHIPRPPNAFMLFRADFVNKGRVPPSIETVHGNLSKIIGAVWRNLPPHEAQFWQIKAAKAKQEHARLHPEYKYRPNHPRSKAAQDAKPQQIRAAARAALAEARGSNFVDAEGALIDVGPRANPHTTPYLATLGNEPTTAQTAHDERRFNVVAKYMLSGMRDEELEIAIKEWEKAHDCETECQAAYSPPSKKRKVANKAKGSARSAASRKRKAGSPASSRESSVPSSDGEFEYKFSFDSRSFQESSSSSSGPITPSPPSSYCSSDSRSPSPYSAISSSSSSQMPYQHGYYQEPMDPSFTGSYVGIHHSFYPPPPPFEQVPQQQDLPRRRSSSVPPPTVTAANFQQFQLPQQQFQQPAPSAMHDTAPVFINPFAPRAENEAPELLMGGPGDQEAQAHFVGGYTDAFGRRMSATRTDAIIGAHRRASSVFGYHPEPYAYGGMQNYFDPAYTMEQGPYDPTMTAEDTMHSSAEYFEPQEYPSLVAPTPMRASPSLLDAMSPAAEENYSSVDNYRPASAPAPESYIPAKQPSFSLESFVDFSACTDESDTKPEDN